MYADFFGIPDEQVAEKRMFKVPVKAKDQSEESDNLKMIITTLRTPL